MHGTIQHGVVCGLSGRLARVAPLLRPDYVTDWLTIPQHIQQLNIHDQVAYVEDLAGPGVVLALDAGPGTEGALRPMGEYDYNTPYSRMDLVSYNGSSYLALADSAGIWPTDTLHWMLMAAKGDSADLGEIVHVGDTAPDEPTPIWMDTAGQPGGWVEVPGGTDWRENVAFYFEEKK